MRTIFFLACVLMGLACATPTLQDRRGTIGMGMGMPQSSAMRGSGPPRRVILLTVAGLESSDFLNFGGHIAREDDRVRMPNLARLAREGSIGIQGHPPSPSSTYVSHATLVTGRLSAKHGITSDFALDSDGSRSLPYWDSRLLKGTALWDAAIGRGVLSLGWPTTVGARIELLVPDATPSDSSTGWLPFISKYSTPMLTRELESIAKAALGKGQDSDAGSRSRDPRTWPTPAEKDAAFVELACRIAASERDPGLWLIRLNQTERAQRIAGYGSVGADAALAQIDAEIGRLVGCLQSAGRLADTALFITGDVAFRGVHTQVDPNAVLVRKGLIGRDPRSSLGVRSWLAIVRSNGRSAFVYARDAANALDARKWLELEAAETDAFEVVPAVDLENSASDPQAWFGLAAKPGFVIGNGLMRPILRPAAARGAAGAFPFLGPETSSVGFVAWGRGIRARVRVPVLELADVAPTIASLLGLRLDDSLSGRPILGILRAVAREDSSTAGPKRLGVGNAGDVDRALRELGGGRDLGRGE